MSNLEVIERYSAAFGERDIDALLACLTDDCVWIIPGDEALTPWGGTRTGHLQIRGFFEEFFKAAVPITGFEQRAVIEHGDVVYSHGVFALQFVASGKTIKDEFIIHFTIRDGKISRYRVFEDSLQLARAYEIG